MAGNLAPPYTIAIPNFPLNHYDSLITGSRVPIVEIPLWAQIIHKLHSNHPNLSPAVQKTMSPLRQTFCALPFCKHHIVTDTKIKGVDCHKGLCLPSKVFEKYLLFGSRVHIILYRDRLLFALRPHTLHEEKVFFSVYGRVVKLYKVF